MRTVNNSEDVLDSLDVIERRDELKEKREDLAAALEEAKTAWEEPTRGSGESQEEQEEQEEQEAREAQIKEQLDEAAEALQEWDKDNAEELAALEAFIDEGSPSWEDGETLVRESYFEDYARELADDVVEDFRERSSQWPFYCIDWEQAARELQYDYTGADFDGVTYYYRA